MSGYYYTRPWGIRFVWRIKGKRLLLFALELGAHWMFEYAEPTYQHRYYFYWPQKLEEGLNAKGIGYKSKPRGVKEEL